MREIQLDAGSQESSSTLDRASVEKLFSVLNELSYVRDIDSITEIVRTSARKLTSADGITFVLKEGDFCFYANESAIQPLWKGRRFPLHSCISGWAMLHAETAIIEDIYEDPRIPHDVYRQTFVKSLVMTPIRKEDPVGAIGAYWASYHRPTQQELEILRTIADASAIALSNAHLYEQLSTSNRRKDELIVMLAHELRNPLAPLRTAAKLLLLSPNDPKKVLAMQQIIDRQVIHLAALVNGLLEMSRLDAGRVTLEPKSVDLKYLMECLARDHERLFAECNQTLELHLPPNGVRMEGDPVRIRQIVENIFDNARKHAGPNVKVEVLLKEEDDRVQLTIQDNGTGIETEFLPYVFEPLSQADRSLDRKKGGLGIGLSVVKGLVELHHGTIVVRSSGVGKGSEFMITFPRLCN